LTSILHLSLKKVKSKSIFSFILLKKEKKLIFSIDYFRFLVVFNIILLVEIWLITESMPRKY